MSTRSARTPTAPRGCWRSRAASGSRKAALAVFLHRRRLRTGRAQQNERLSNALGTLVEGVDDLGLFPSSFQGVGLVSSLGQLVLKRSFEAQARISAAQRLVNVALVTVGIVRLCLVLVAVGLVRVLELHLALSPASSTAAPRLEATTGITSKSR